MKVRIHDIPQEGLELAFDLDKSSLNTRASLSNRKHGKVEESIEFIDEASVNLKLEIQGTTVLMTGVAGGKYLAVCSRCAEESTFKLPVKVNLIVKPKSGRDIAGAEDEDVNVSFYSGTELDCSQLVEDLLILALPYCNLCSDTCRGICANCGGNLNTEGCVCPQNAKIMQ